MVTLENIKQEVEKETNLSDLSTKLRERPYVIARCIYCALAYKFTPHSYATIGRSIDRHHASVMYCIESLDGHLSYEPFFKEVYERLNELFLEKRRENLGISDREKLLALINQIPERKYKNAIEILETI